MKTELVLPIEMYKLSLEEIGAIFILMASPHMDEKFKDHWQQNTQFRQTYVELKNEGIVLNNDGELKIDLTWV